VSFDELSGQNFAKLSGTDEYFKDADSFHVLGHDVTVSGEQKTEARNALPTDRRDILLLSDFLASDRTEALRFVRSNFAGRAIHSGIEAWKRKLAELWHDTGFTFSV
jgi:hypothetical protein